MMPPGAYRRLTAPTPTDCREHTALTWDFDSSAWTATAIGPGERATGWGNFHYQALNNLAIKLREIRGPTLGSTA
jgi:hypothetical protein